MSRSLVLCAVLALVGCGRFSDLPADDGGDELEMATSEAALLSEQTVLDAEAPQGQCTALSPEALAQRAAMKAAERFSPSSCVTATANGPAVTYVLTNCTGKYGWIRGSGTFTTTFANSNAGVLSFTVRGTGLGERGATFDVDASATCARSGDARVFTVASTIDATGPRGRTVKHTGAYSVTLTPSTECVAVAGTWTNRFGPYQRTTSVQGFERCAGACPKAGGEVVILTARETSTTVSFDGTNQASWTAGRRSGTVDLQCGN